MKHLFFLWLVIGSLLMQGCRKEDLGKAPAIKIEAPYHDELFTTGDSVFIPVKATITASHTLRCVSLTLVNSNFKKVAPDYRFEPGTKEFTLSFEYPLHGLVLESGGYYLEVFAEDENDAKRSYRQIKISAQTAALHYVIPVTAGNQGVRVHLYNPGLTLNSSTDIQCDYADSEYNSEKNLLFVAGRYTTNLLAYEIEQDVVSWELPLTPFPPFHSGNCLYSHDDRIFVSYQKDYIRSYSHTGGILASYHLQPDERAGCVITLNGMVVAEIHNPSSGEKYLSAFYQSSGVWKQKIQITFSVTGFFPESDHRLLITGNSGKGVLLSYDVFNNLLLQELDFDSEITAAVQTGQNVIIVATSEGLYRYKPGCITPEPVVSGSAYQILTYDDLNKMLYAASGNAIDVYSIPSCEKQHSLNLPDSVLNIHLDYMR